MYWGVAKVLASQGRRTVVTEVVHQQALPNALHPNVLRIQAQAGYAVMKWVGEEYGSEQADVIAHSMGGLTTTAIAERHPHRIRSISYTGSAGQDGHRSIWHRLGGTTRVVGREIVPSIQGVRSDYDPTRSILLDAAAQLAHPVRTLREAMTVAQADDRAGIRNLRDNTAIHLGAVLLENDGYFDPADVLTASRGLFHDVLFVKHAMHIDPVARPHHHAAVQLQMLDQLNHTVELSVV